MADAVAPSTSRVLTFAIAGVLAAAAPGLCLELTASELRGKEIYLTGRSPSGGEVTAVMGIDGIRLPGRAATCGGCHGHDGTGRPESGIIPYNVTWRYLTKSYGHVHDSGLAHGPFDEESLEHYMRTGGYPGGAAGDPSMPRYELSDADLEDLVAYLKRVGEEVDPGVGDTTITVATVIPTTGPLAEMGGAIRDVLARYFDRVNLGGGLYGREIVLEVHELPTADPQNAAGQLATWMAARQPFALVSPFTPGLDAVVNGAALEERVPVIGPWTLYPVATYSLNRSVFYLVSGLVEQTRALIAFASLRLQADETRVAVLHPTGQSVVGAVESTEAACRDQGWATAAGARYEPADGVPRAAVRQLRDRGIDVVISLAAEPELRGFLEAAAEEGWTPWVLAPGVLTGTLAIEAPEPFRDRLLLAYPTLPRDRKPWAVREMSSLIEGSERARSHPQAAISAYAAASVLTEGLRRAGRDLGRSELKASLESLYRFDTGLMPLITFTPNRRIGARGAYVVALGDEPVGERTLLEAAEWVEVD